jgi:branched-subunit amino acid aminotransferase/4-amino-4-deoxychorismate lyase
VTRDKILRVMPHIEVREIAAEELRRADEIMLAGTITMVASVTRLDGRPVGDGKIGKAALAMYDALVGDIRRECVTTPLPPVGGVRGRA